MVEKQMETRIAKWTRVTQDFECQTLQFSIYSIVSGEALKKLNQSSNVISLVAVTAKRPFADCDYAGGKRVGFCKQNRGGHEARMAGWVQMTEGHKH